MKVGMVGVSVVVNWVRGSVHAILRDAHEGAEFVRGLAAENPTVLFAASQTRWVVDVDVADITRGTDDRWAPTVEQLAICGLPAGHDEWERFAVTVGRHVGDQWSVRWSTSHLDVDGVPAVIPRDCDWTRYLMPIDQAMRVARHHARTVTRGGRTADQVMREEQDKREEIRGNITEGV